MSKSMRKHAAQFTQSEVVVLSRQITQKAALIFREELSQQSAVEQIKWNKLVESSRIKSWDNIEEVYECKEVTTEGEAVNVFFRTKKGVGLPNFRMVPGLGFLLPASALGNELVSFLNGQLK